MTTVSADHACVVVGAGPAGLGVAALMKKLGVDALIVDQAPRVADSWRSRYEGFRLNTSSWFSYLPGRRFPRAAGRWPSRDALVDYYEAYAEHEGLAFQLATAVERIERRDGRWELRTSQGSLYARCVVVATGKYHTPTVPAWLGSESFEGELIHSASYRDPGSYVGRDVLVVGPGASGCEIATQLASGGARRVWLSIRTPPHIIRRDIGPFPSDLFAVIARRLPVWLVDRIGELIRRISIGDLSDYGLGRPPDGIYTRVRSTGMIPTIDGPYVEAVKRRLLTIVPAVDRFEGSEVVLADQSRLSPDVVIAATGYRRDLEPLVGHLGVVRDDGHPAVHGAKTHPCAPRLYFTGFTEPFSGNLREIRLNARAVARAVDRDLW